MDFDPSKYNPELTPEQIRGYLEGTLSPEELRIVEERLVDDPFAAEAMEGMEMLGADKMDSMLDSLHADIDIIASGAAAETGTQGLNRRSTSSGAKVRTLSTARWISVAAILSLFAGSIYFLQQTKSVDDALAKSNEQTFEENFTPFDGSETVNGSIEKGKVRQAPEEDDGFIPIIDGGFTTTQAPDIEVEKSEEIIRNENFREDLLDTQGDFALDEEIEAPSEAEVLEYKTSNWQEDILEDQDLIPAEGELADAEEVSLKVSSEFESQIDSVSTGGTYTFNPGLGGTIEIPSDVVSTASNTEPQAVESNMNKDFSTYDRKLEDKVYAPTAPSFEPQSNAGYLSGIITDQLGNPLPGAVISVDGGFSSNADMEGFFSLKVPAGVQTLKVDYVGFDQYREPLVISADENRELDIELEEASLALDEVVVAQESTERKRAGRAQLESYDGYGNSRKPEALTGRDYYNKGDYANALPYFEVQLQTEPNNSELLLLCANCYLETENPEAAAAQLDLILLQVENEYTEEAKWYLALAKIKLNQTAEARIILNEIIAEEGEYKRDAKKVLKDLGY